jgi:hypothetical protein
MVSGAIQAMLEAAAFLYFGKETWQVALWMLTGNTVTHGILMGAIPLVLIIPRLYGRVERYLGYAPRGMERHERPSAPQPA